MGCRLCILEANRNLILTLVAAVWVGTAWGGLLHPLVPVGEQIPLWHQQQQLCKAEPCLQFINIFPTCGSIASLHEFMACDILLCFLFCFLTCVLCLRLKGFIGLPGSKGTQGEQVSDGTLAMPGLGCRRAVLQQPKAPALCAMPVLRLDV